MKPGKFLLFTLLLFFLYSDIAAQKIHEKEYCDGYPTITCTTEFQPHCGSDDKTYASRCTFCNAYVESDRRLHLRYLGLCEFEDAED